MDSRIGWDLTLAALLLSLALSLVVSWVYVATYRGLSYVRGFATTLGISGVVSALVMLAIGDDVARGIGLVAVFLQPGRRSGSSLYRRNRRVSVGFITPAFYDMA